MADVVLPPARRQRENLTSGDGMCFRMFVGIAMQIFQQARALLKLAPSVI